MSPAQVSSLSLATFTAGLSHWSSLGCWPGQAGPHPLGWDWPAELTHGPLSAQSPDSDKPGTCAGGWLILRVGGDVCAAGDARVEDESKLKLIH